MRRQYTKNNTTLEIGAGGLLTVIFNTWRKSIMRRQYTKNNTTLEIGAGGVLTVIFNTWRKFSPAISFKVRGFQVSSSTRGTATDKLASRRKAHRFRTPGPASHSLALATKTTTTPKRRGYTGHQMQRDGTACARVVRPPLQYGGIDEEFATKLLILRYKALVSVFCFLLFYLSQASVSGFRRELFYFFSIFLTGIGPRFS